MAKRKLSARLVIFSISFLALIFFSLFLYERAHWKIAIAAKNDLGVPLRVEIDVCDRHKEIKLDAKEFRIDCCLSIKRVDDDLIFGTLRIFDEAKDCLLYETKLNRHGSIWGQNNDEFPLRLDFMVFQNSNGNCDVAYGAKWKDVRIECFAEWDGTDYNFLLKDEKNRYWLYKMPLFSPDEPYTLFFNKDECFLDDAEDHLDEQLYPLIKPTDFFYMNGLSGIFKEGKKFTVWGSSVIDTEEFLNANRGSEDFGFHKIVEEQIQIDDKNIKKILCGQFLPEVTYLISMDRMKNGPYAAFFYKDGSLRLFANGREYKIGKEKGIKKVFDGYNIIFQTKDERIFFIGYNLYDSLGDYDSEASEDENNFVFCKEVK